MSVVTTIDVPDDRDSMPVSEYLQVIAESAHQAADYLGIPVDFLHVRMPTSVQVFSKFHEERLLNLQKETDK